MKTIISLLLVLAWSGSGFAVTSECRVQYGITADISNGDKVRALLAKVGGANDLLANYESHLEKISAELGLAKETVGVEIAKIFKQLVWLEVAPGLRVRNVIEVPGTEMKGTMYLLAPGFKVPPHKHGGDELTVMIEGTFESDGVVYRAGQTIRREVGTIDPPGVAGSEGALLFVFRVAPVQPVSVQNQ